MYESTQTIPSLSIDFMRISPHDQTFQTAAAVHASSFQTLTHLVTLPIAPLPLSLRTLVFLVVRERCYFSHAVGRSFLRDIRLSRPHPLSLVCSREDFLIFFVCCPFLSFPSFFALTHFAHHLRAYNFFFRLFYELKQQHSGSAYYNSVPGYHNTPSAHHNNHHSQHHAESPNASNSHSVAPQDLSGPPSAASSFYGSPHHFEPPSSVDPIVNSPPTYHALTTASSAAAAYASSFHNNQGK